MCDILFHFIFRCNLIFNVMPICKLMPAGNLTPNLHVSGGGEVVIPMQRVDDPYIN